MADRTISVIGLSALGLPEFVSGVFLIMIFGIWLNVLPLARPRRPAPAWARRCTT